MDELSPRDLQALFEATPTAVVLVDREGIVRTVNPRAAEMFDYEPEELAGRPVEVLVPEGLRDVHREHRREYMEDPVRRPMGIGMELEARRRGGETFPVEISLSPVETEAGFRVMAAVRDLTERRKLRSWGAEAVEAAEEERARVARELHDDTAQRFAALQVQAKLAMSASDEERRRELLGRIRDELREGAESVRRLIRGLRPPALDEVGLMNALRGQASRRLDDGTEVRVREAADGTATDRLGDQRRLVAYRVVQEALNNVARHADAGRVVLAIRDRDDGLLEIRVEDDGRGFDPREVRREEEGLGLVGMRERAAAVDGTVEVDSAPGEGTTVRLLLPLSPDGRPPPRRYAGEREEYRSG